MLGIEARIHNLIARSKGLNAIYDAVAAILPVTSTGVIVEDGATGTPCVTTLYTSTNPNTFGDWVQIDASVSGDSWICGVIVTPGAAAVRHWVLEIGTGAGGAESTKIRFSWRDGGSATPGPFVLPVSVPIKVTSGTRIAARVSNSTGQEDCKVAVQYYQSL